MITSASFRSACFSPTHPSLNAAATLTRAWFLFSCAALMLSAEPIPNEKPSDLPEASTPAALQVAPGFKVDLLYSVPKAEQGSWVSIALDPQGRLLTADQYGSLYRISLPPINTAKGTQVERLKIALPAVPLTPDSETTPKRMQDAEGGTPAVGAHGLLYAFDSLYIMVGEAPNKRGLWRLRDTNGDDQFDEQKYLRAIKGSGEHGPHSLALSPDGKSIYFANGNHTDLPVNMEKSRAVRWDEDQLLPRMWDARGHAKNKYAPGGYIGRTDPEGKSVELFALGFRNQFDLAFDQNGELFTYDSDMEWDQGAPWYMPTRINHVVDAGDYGWRSGAGRWPAYYSDSLPAALDIGPGCPTGTVFGTGAKFPAAYQTALFACDWTYGTLYAIHLTPDGATFRGTKEEFVAGKPLPLTDLVVNPHDGALYFIVGGRKTQSALYRVTYVGTENTQPVAPPAPTPEAILRRSLEALHVEGVGPEAIDTIWPHLGHSDRFVRFAARAALERQLPQNWAKRALQEKNPSTALEALTALARVGERSYQARLIDALIKFDFVQQPTEFRFRLVRAWQLAFTRMGKPEAATCARLLSKLDPLFPQSDALMNRELLALLVYLDSPTIVGRAVPLLTVAEPRGTSAEELASHALLARNDGYGQTVANVAASRPDRQQIAVAYTLRNATVGWTPALREKFFAWFPRTHHWMGGASFTGFLKNIRSESLAKVSNLAERTALDELSKAPVHAIVTGAAIPRGPGRAYTLKDTLPLFPAKLTGRDFAQGKAMFAATACTVCHRFNGEGIGIAPDISDAGRRYSVRDLLENIIEPSLVISDQYGSEEFTMPEGNAIVGRVLGEEDGWIKVMTNPFAPDEAMGVEIAKIIERKPYPVSMMPPGLINALNPDELKDLLAYILSGGNPADAMFAPQP